MSFDEFWSVCPRKLAKKDARTAWDRAVKKTDPSVLLQGMMRYAAQRTGKNPQFTLHPASWLNGERWNDPQENFHERPRTIEDAADDLIARAEDHERQACDQEPDIRSGGEQGGQETCGPVRIAARSRP